MKRILVALDSSPRAPVVLGAAARLAELANATIVMFRAVEVPPDMPREILNVTDRGLEEILLRNARTDLEQLAAQIGVRTEHVAVAIARPSEGILRAARDHAADLIVLGSHGFGGMDRILGTTAAKVTNHADRNVLVVRAPL